MSLNPSQVSNMDVAGLCDRVTFYALELKNSQSAHNGGFFLPADRDRLATYLDRLENFAAAANSTPLDLPKIHAVGYSLLKSFPSDGDVESIENQDVKDVIRRFKALWIDLANSQSADLASGINKFDLARFRSVIESCRSLLAMATESIDLPENIGNKAVPAPVADTAPSTRSTAGAF